MNPPQFAMLLAKLESARDDEAREDAVGDLAWIFYSGNWEVAEGEPVLQKLVNMIGPEPNKNIGNLVLEALEGAYGITDSWNRKEIRLDLDPLVRMLNSLNSANLTGNMCRILDILGESGQAKYRDACAPYLDHSNQGVRQAAEFAIERLKSVGAGQG